MKKVVSKMKIDKRSKYILIMGIVLLLFGVIYRIYPVLQGMQTGSDEMQLKLKQLAKYRQMVKEEAGIKTRVQYMERLLKRLESGLLTGETSSLAAVDIQNNLNEIAGKSNVTLKMVRVLKAEKVEEKPYLSVPVQFTVDTNINQLLEVLYGICTSTKILTTKEVKINVATRRRTTTIHSDITVSGLMKKFED
jgi:Tfp pilus assembly protein PilO